MNKYVLCLTPCVGGRNAANYGPCSAVMLLDVTWGRDLSRVNQVVCSFTVVTSIGVRRLNVSVMVKNKRCSHLARLVLKCIRHLVLVRSVAAKPVCVCVRISVPTQFVLLLVDPS